MVVVAPSLYSRVMTDDGMARLIGLVLLVPGLGLLGFGAWSMYEMMQAGMYSLRLMLCCGLLGGGLTIVGLGKLLGGSDDE